MFISEKLQRLTQVMEKRDECTSSTQVIIAALNEEEGVGLTIAEFMVYLGSPRVLVVDGRSTDRTIEIAAEILSRMMLEAMY